jgi:hypothetical protein
MDFLIGIASIAIGILLISLIFGNKRKGQPIQQGTFAFPPKKPKEDHELAHQ